MEGCNLNPTYTLGIDFGTLSARSVLVDIQTGEERISCVYEYPDGVIDKTLPGSCIPLPRDFSLQNPADYQTALEYLLTETWRQGGITPDAVHAIGVDFTACTMLPVDRTMTPLCFDPAYRENPHSWAKLWKHHGAQEEAQIIAETVRRRGETFLRRYGNQSSSEWYVAKLLEVYRKSPDIYHAASQFINASDWVTYLMTGVCASSYCTAGFKCFWSPREGYPNWDFFESLAPGFGNAMAEKMTTDILPMGVPCGTLCPEMATKTGLIPGTPVAVSVIDAHAALPAVGIKGSGALLMSMGTSLCHIMVSEKEAMVPGISGVVEEGILPGLYGYEAGQSAVGDIFQWFVENFPGAALESEAKAADVNLFDMITKNAASLAPGESGLIALDWWNGNRSLLGNSGLRGMILGLSLQTRPEEVYRCLVEATAFGARTILENFISHGVPVETIYACGGLPRKSPLVMQIYADVLGRDIHISNITQAAAYGAAMYAMVALGAERGGYDTVEDAVDHLICPSNQCYHPSPENHAVYDRLFAVYQTLHDYFGREHPEIMAALNPQAGKDRKKNG